MVAIFRAALEASFSTRPQSDLVGATHKQLELSQDILLSNLASLPITSPDFTASHQRGAIGEAQEDLGSDPNPTFPGRMGKSCSIFGIFFPFQLL
jgi:hypothetical protein